MAGSYCETNAEKAVHMDGLIVGWEDLLVFKSGFHSCEYMDMNHHGIQI